MRIKIHLKQQLATLLRPLTKKNIYGLSILEHYFGPQYHACIHVYIYVQIVIFNFHFHSVITLHRNLSPLYIFL